MTLEGLIIAAMLIATIVSLTLAMALTYLYLRIHQLHIAIWSFALYFMGFRVLVLLITTTECFCTSDTIHFMNDVLLILVDILWIYGIFHFLNYRKEKKDMLVYGFSGYLILITILFALNTPESILAGEGLTLVAVHPILLSYLFWIFYTSGKEVGSKVMQYLGIAFLLWAADFILFGIPYFIYKDPVAGALGWTIGMAFRFMLICSFLEMRREAKKMEETTTAQVS